MKGKRKVAKNKPEGHGALPAGAEAVAALGMAFPGTAT
jgi:hypothetical protein